MQWLGQRLSASLGETTKAGQESKGKSHGTINGTTKREKLSGCTFAWPAEDLTSIQPVCFSCQLKKVAQLSQAPSNHCQSPVSLLR